MNRILILMMIFIGSSTLGYSQIEQVWISHKLSSDKIAKDKAVERQSFPKEVKLFDLNITPLKKELFSVVGKQAIKRSVVISLPSAAGTIEQYQVFESSNFEPDLQNRFPQIRAFSGKGITDESATLKLTISPQGIQAMVFRTDKENEFVEAFSEDHAVYATFKSERAKGMLPWRCTTVDKATLIDINNKIKDSNKPSSSAGELKTIRLAQSVTAEYSNYFGATSSAQVGLVLSAINATLARCNAIFERDLAVHLNLIASTTSVIYYDAATDPYSPAASGAGGNWNGELQETLTSVIGDSNYDIGHLFGASGGGGNAGCIGCICESGKGSAFTSPADAIPQGDNFDIDYVAHEIGHQLGATHTFSFTLEDAGTNKEVGSGITIMGYAGITPQDVAPHSIDIFHEASIEQIQNNLAAKTCPITTNVSATNATPVVASVANYTIPISTPFALTGSATDANSGDILTYCWEQNDNSTTSGNASVASPTKLAGPNWLSFTPTVSPTRLFPRLSSILAGALTTGPLPGGDAGATIEALSSVSRTLNFRLTVRDNAPYSSTAPIKVGQTAFTDMVVTVTNTSGPFQVTSPNTNVTYAEGSTQIITWDVNNTSLPPVNCANVKISYSTDGGLTFPTVLASGTPNDGAEAITLPIGITNTARIKVEAVGNVFFDISNSNFSVTAPLVLAAVIVSQPTAQIACIPSAASFSVNAVGTCLSYQWQVSTNNGSSYTDIPLATSATYTTGVTSSSLNGNLYRVIISNNCLPTIPVISNSVSLTAINPVAITQNPLPQSGCALDNYTFAVTAMGSNLIYQWQVSTDGGVTYNNVLPGLPAGPTTSGTTATYTINNAPLSFSGNFYRAIVTGQPCGIATTSAAQLRLSNKPSVVLSAPAISNTNPSLNTILTVAVSPLNANIIYLWKRNGVLLPNTLSATSIKIAVDDEATYQVTTTDISTGCQSISNTISTSAATSDNLIKDRVFIYPNPVKTITQVRFNNSSSLNRNTMLNIYDVRGVRVFSKLYSISGTLGRMDVDLTRLQSGTYMLYLMDNMGKKLAGSKIIKIN